MGATADKLNKLNQTKTAIKEALETPYNVFADYPALIKKYVNNQPTSKVSDGVCKNSLNVPLVSLGVDGNCEQNSYEGYNKFNYEDFVENVSSTVVSGEAKSFKLSTNGGTYDFKDLKENTSYCVSGRVMSNIVNGSLSLVYSDGSSTTIFEQYDNALIDKTFKINSNASKTLTTLKITIYGNTSITINDFMIYEGTEDKPYEPYVGGQPSPNPNYKQDIEVIDGANLLNSILISQTKNGLNIIVNKDKTIILNGTSTAYTELYLHGYWENNDPINKDKEALTFSIGSNIEGIALWFYHNSTLVTNGNFGTGTISVADKFVSSIALTIESGKTYDNVLIKPMINKGTIPEPYLPYGCIGLLQQGKNFLGKDFDFSKSPNEYGWQTTIGNEYITSVFENNILELVTGTSVTGGSLMYFLNNLLLL